MALLLAILVLILISIAFSIGYWYRTREMEKMIFPQISRDYLAGINFIINDETDKAVDHFIKMLNVDSDTVETHLALGKLFRRRGEVDRAIRIHQNLIARPTLDKYYRDQSLFALGCDYLSAGMLDRAERIFLDITKEKRFIDPAIKMLLDIYQQEKSWQKGIDLALQYQINNPNQRIIISHFYCELADNLIKTADFKTALQHLEQALFFDSNSVRALLLRGQCLIKQGHYQEALLVLKKIEEKNNRYFTEVLPLIVSTYEALNDIDELQQYLFSVAERYPTSEVLNILANVLQKLKGDQHAANFVKNYVRQHPSVSGALLYLQLTLSFLQGQTHEDLFLLQKILKKMLAKVARYQCSSCGFSGNVMHWLCPHCKQWGTVLPHAMYEEKHAQ